MKTLVIGSITLALLMPLGSAFADEWEERQERKQMMMERESGMHSDGAMRHREDRMGMGRESRLDPDSPRTVEDLENLPATAAGREERKRMMGEDRQHQKRRGHRGEIEGGY